MSWTEQNGKHHEHARCQNGVNCDGPGCRVRTGKTRAKRDHVNRGAEADLKKITSKEK